MPYRLGLDLGANSLGWCLLKLDKKSKHPVDIIDMGVRIYPDGRNPKDKESLAKARRLARQQRRRRDRYLNRRARLLQALIHHGLLPDTKDKRKELENEDPYTLRATGLDNKLSLHQLGRAIFHLHQRRGFKSNRKVDKQDEQESGLIKSAINKLQDEVKRQGCRTVGEYLYRRLQEGKPILSRREGLGANAEYELYIDRSMISDEFDALWHEQQRYHPQLTEPMGDELRSILLFQRPLRSPKPGRCTFEDEPRAPLALPLSQSFRIYQEINNLRTIEEDHSLKPLTLQQRDILAQRLLQGKDLTFGAIRKALGTRKKFNLEDGKRKKLLADQTAAKLGSDKSLGKIWHEFDAEKQQQVVETLLSDLGDAKVFAALADLGLSEELAQKAMFTPLPDGYGRLGKTAMNKIVKELMSAVITYDKAAEKAGYNHSQLHPELHCEELPYYGEILQTHVIPGSNIPDDPDEIRYGKITNPTVHIGLNQLRKIVNAIIRKHGKPEQIVVELTRELKLGKEKQKEIQKRQQDNQQRNERIDRELQNIGQSVNSDNRLRYKLWEELNLEDPLDRRCPFTGASISISKLFSSEVEIEHLLPLARTLDDSIANKTVSLRRANRYKGNQPPYEAFGHSPDEYNWDSILERAESMPANKSWRFAPDAMDRYLREESDFLARHLNDTAYLSRVSREYLTAVCPNVWVTPGRLTSMLRAKWGLNSLLSDANRKERTDHRHHAIDALVVGMTDRNMLRRISTASARATEKGLTRTLERMPLPWESFRERANACTERITVSYKPDHGVQGRLHNATAYGLAGDIDSSKGAVTAIHRKPLLDFRSHRELLQIRDTAIRDELLYLTDGLSGSELKAALQSYSEQTGIRRLRITEHLSLIPLCNREGKPYKGVKGDSNYCYEIWRADNGKWDGRIITTFEANQQPYRDFMKDRPYFLKHAFNGKPLVMRLLKNDMLAIQQGEDRKIMVVSQISPGKIVIVDHFQAGDLKRRDRDQNDLFKYMTRSPQALRKLQSRRVFVDITGKVKDPGFSE